MNVGAWRSLVGEGGTDERAPRLLATRTLLLIGLGFFVAQVTLVPLDRPPTWDEAVYLSQVTPGMHGVHFVGWHARGITLIVAPATSLGATVEQVRFYLMVVSSLAAIAAFLVWVPLIGGGAAIAAFLFCSSWVVLAAGSFVMPNLWAAILGVGATGAWARRVDGGEARHLAVAISLVAAMALVRPSEATLLAIVLASGAVVVRREAWRDVIGLGTGLALGWLPWVVEMSIRFGGIGGAIEQAQVGRHAATVPLADGVVKFLGYAGGRTSYSVVLGTAWWLVLAALAIIGALRSSGALRLACVSSGSGALVLAAEYLFFVPVPNPRFVLPAFALASISAACGLMALLRAWSAAAAIGAIVLALLVPWAVWQGSIAARLRGPRGPEFNLPGRVGLAIRDLAGGRPCFVFTARMYPQIAYAARCRGDRVAGFPDPASLDRVRRQRLEIFVMLLRDTPKAGALASVTPIRFPHEGRDWYLYHLPRSGP